MLPPAGSVAINPVINATLTEPQKRPSERVALQVDKQYHLHQQSRSERKLGPFAATLARSTARGPLLPDRRTPSPCFPPDGRSCTQRHAADPDTRHPRKSPAVSDRAVVRFPLPSAPRKQKQPTRYKYIFLYKIVPLVHITFRPSRYLPAMLRRISSVRSPHPFRPADRSV